MMQKRKVRTFFLFHMVHKQVKVRTLKPLFDIMSNLAMIMPHLAPFEGILARGMVLLLMSCTLLRRQKCLVLGSK
jgi:hypothetical protein